MMEPINATALLLREERLEIRYKDRTGNFDAKVYFDLAISNSVIIEPEESVDEICDFIAEGPFVVTFAGCREPVECYSAKSNVRLGGEQSGHFVRLSPLRSPIVLSSGEPLFRIEAGVLNFANYFLSGRSEQQRFELSSSDWIFTFTPVDDHIYQYPPQIQTDEYAFTHHVSVARSEGASFSLKEAQQQLALLSDFLTFCRGFWVSTALTSAIAVDGTAVMEELGARMVSPRKRSSNWLDFHHGDCMVELFPKFVSLMANLSWQETLRQALYWYVRADTNLVGPDGGCFLLQAALERLAWHVLVRERKSVSENGFSKLPAADQVRLLLSTMSIPLGIPDDLAELRNAAKTLNWQDGPQAFVEVRNRLVHPPKPNRQTVSLPYFQAYTLGKWYVELILLSACGYRGKYSNRTKIQRWIGEVEEVPWS